MMKSDSKYWVFLADPTDYGWPELERAGSAVWDGIKNARAQQNLRQTSPQDQVLIYHTAPDKALVGIARVTSAARPDPKAVERVVVDVEPVKALKRRLPLSELKSDSVLAQMSFVRMPRVAVQPVSAEQWRRVLQLSGTTL